MYSSPIQAVLSAGKEAFSNGFSRRVPNQYARMDITHFAFLKGWDEMAAKASRKK